MVRKHDPDAVHLRLRVGSGLLRKLEQAAKRANRSLNNEVVTRLDSSFRAPVADTGEEQRMKALADQMAEMRRELDAIKHQAVAVRARPHEAADHGMKDATEAALQAIQQALSIEPGTGAETEQPTDKQAGQRRAKS